MDEKKVREAIAWMKNERIIYKHSIYVSPLIPKEQINLNEEYYNLAIKALEKQLPKKSKQADEQRIRYCTTHVCPGCGKEFTGMVSEYCYHCGQRIEYDD